MDPVRNMYGCTIAIYLTTKLIPCLWFVQHDIARNNVHVGYTLLNESNNIWHETISCRTLITGDLTAPGL